MEDGDEAGEPALDLGDIDQIGLTERRLGAARCRVVDLGDERRTFGNRRIGERKAGQRRRARRGLGWQRRRLDDRPVGIELGQQPAVWRLARDDRDSPEALDGDDLEYGGRATRGGG